MDLRNVNSLTPHPDHVKLYGVLSEEKLDPKFVESIRKEGVKVDVTITVTNVIVSGVCRCFATKLTERITVPVKVLPPETDELTIKELLVTLNMQRVKTKDDIAREAAYLTEIKEERARRRMEAGGAKGRAQQQNDREKDRPPTILSEATPAKKGEGDTRKQVGKDLGLGEVTAGKAAVIGKAIAEAAEQGDQEKEERLRETVRERGYDAAYKQVKEESKPPDPEDTPVKRRLREMLAEYLQAERDIIKLKSTLISIGGVRGGEEMADLVQKTLFDALDAIQGLIFDVRPAAVNSEGWVSQKTWDNMDDDERSGYKEL